MTEINNHIRHTARPSPLLAAIWTSARDSAYAAGHGSEFDAITSEIEAIKAAGPLSLDAAMAMWALAQQRRILVAPPSASALAAQ